MIQPVFPSQGNWLLTDDLHLMPEKTITPHIQLLLDRLAKGDPAATRELIALAYNRLLVMTRKLMQSFVRVRVEDETVDVLHGAFERLQRALETAKPATPRDFFGLAALKIRQQLLDRVRSIYGRDAGAGGPDGGRGKVRPLPLGAAPGGEDSNAAGFDPADSAVDVRRLDVVRDLLEAIEQLGEDQRQVVDLHILHGFTQQETAEILEVDPSTVKRRWAAARVKLARMLQDFAPTG